MWIPDPGSGNADKELENNIFNENSIKIIRKYDIFDFAIFRIRKDTNKVKDKKKKGNVNVPLKIFDYILPIISCSFRRK